jgi:hypothetical protein
MKNIILLNYLFLCLIFVSSATKNELIGQQLSVKVHRDWNGNKIYGKVKRVSETNYKAIEVNGEISNSDLLKVDTCWYNNLGNAINAKAYNPDGGLASKKKFKIDDKGNCIEDDSYYSDGSLHDKEKRKYDDNGNMIEENDYEPDGGLIFKNINKYDANGNNIEKKNYNSDGILRLKTISKYDVKGNVIEEDCYNSDGSLDTKLTVNYEGFDKKGNWLKMIVFENSKLEGITERKMVYYDK